MDIQTATAAHIVKEFGGKEYTFRRLTMRDMGVLGMKKTQLDSTMIPMKLEALRDSELSKSEIITALNEFSESNNHAEIIHWAYQTKGAMAVLELSIEEGDVEVLLESIDHISLMDLALVLIGARYYEESSEKKSTEAEKS